MLDELEQENLTKALIEIFQNNPDLNHLLPYTTKGVELFNNVEKLAESIPGYILDITPFATQKEDLSGVVCNFIQEVIFGEECDCCCDCCCDDKDEEPNEPEPCNCDVCADARARQIN